MFGKKVYVVIKLHCPDMESPDVEILGVFRNHKDAEKCIEYNPPESEDYIVYIDEQDLK